MRAIVFALLSATTLVGCASAGSSVTSMSTYGYAFAPPAFYDFCEREAGLCASSGPQKAMAFSDRRMTELQQVTARVNASIRQVDDAPGDGGDLWRVPDTSGDCEDIAIKKKKQLMALGWPSSTLLLTVVRPRFGAQGHTVLTARTSSGDYILDNLSSKVSLWSDTSYRFFARQSQERHGEWEQIEGRG